MRVPSTGSPRIHGFRVKNQPIHIFYIFLYIQTSNGILFITLVYYENLNT